MPQKLAISHDMTRPTFSKLTQLQVIQVISGGPNRNEMYLRAKLYCKVPQV